jgi:hypothetical protein
MTPRARVCALLLVVAVILVGVSPGAAWHGRVHIGVGPIWWGPPYPYWPYAPYYYPYSYWPPPYGTYWPPPVIVQESQTYIQQPVPAPPSRPEAYWYYCPSARAYYPTVSECPEPWVKVPPRPE